jgi:hypothetical protein
VVDEVSRGAGEELAVIAGSVQDLLQILGLQDWHAVVDFFQMLALTFVLSLSFDLVLESEIFDLSNETESVEELRAKARSEKTYQVLDRELFEFVSDRGVLVQKGSLGALEGLHVSNQVVLQGVNVQARRKIKKSCFFAVFPKTNERWRCAACLQFAHISRHQGFQSREVGSVVENVSAF